MESVLKEITELMIIVLTVLIFLFAIFVNQPNNIYCIKCLIIKRSIGKKQEHEPAHNADLENINPACD